MVIGITGHTSGLGLQIAKHFEDTGHAVVGFSRSNGYSLPENFHRVVDVAKKCDVFFNNAYVDTVQAQFIEALHNYVPVVTSGSMGADYTSMGKKYYYDKAEIEAVHRKYKKISNQPMLLLKMGYLENYTEYKSIAYSEVLAFIDTWLNNRRCSVVEFDNINYNTGFK